MNLPDRSKWPEGATHWSPAASCRLEAYWKPASAGSYDCWAITEGSCYWQQNDTDLPSFAIKLEESPGFEVKIKAKWAIAPEWALAFGQGPTEEYAYVGDDGYQYVGFSGMKPFSNPTNYQRNDFTVLEVRPAAWNGEDLPPAGTICEFSRKACGNWGRVEILYVGKQRIFFRDRDGDELSRSHGECDFRPIRTAEQIKADERQRAIKQMIDDAGGAHVTTPEDLAANLYDMNYRKQVKP